MSKEFEQAFDAARESLPTMSQGFMSTQSCYEARELHMFRAGRALGRREMKGPIEYALSGFDMVREAVEKGFNDEALLHLGHHQSWLQKSHAAIEAIPEEV